MNYRQIIKEEVIKILEFMSTVHDKALGKDVDVLSFDDQTTDEELEGVADHEMIIASLGFHHGWGIKLGNEKERKKIKPTSLSSPVLIPKGTEYEFTRGSGPGTFKVIKNA